MLSPILNILPEAQRKLWAELTDTPKDFVLYGGTAIALRLGHRQSVDFDFFSSRSFSPSELLNTIPYLKGATVQQSAENTLTCLVDRGDVVQVSFLGGLSLNRVQDPDIAEDNRIPVATLLDLAATKMKVILDRASYKDYFDIATLLDKHIILADALAAAKAVYGNVYNPLLSLKALAYFEEGDVQKLPELMRTRLLDAISKIQLDALPVLSGKQGLL